MGLLLANLVESLASVSALVFQPGVCDPQPLASSTVAVSDPVSRFTVNVLPGIAFFVPVWVSERTVK